MSSPNPLSLASSALPASAELLAVRGVEAMSRPYEYELWVGVVSSAMPEDLGRTLGQRVRFSVSAGEDEPQMDFAGVISAAELIRDFEEQALLRLVVVPRLWMLSQSRHSRVFVNQTVPEVIGFILEENGLGGSWDSRLFEQYGAHEHICQYCESDLTFLSRWMEREGIYYYFEVGEAGERLVLTDVDVYAASRLQSSLPYHPFGAQGQHQRQRRVVRSFTSRAQSIPCGIELQDRNPAKYQRAIDARRPVLDGDHPAVHTHACGAPDAASIERRARLEAEALLARRTAFFGSSNSLHLAAGRTFSLAEHPRAAFNRKYLVVEARLLCATSVLPEFSADFELPADESVSVEFVAIPADVQFRPEKVTAWPRIYGYETALVEGPADSDYAQIDDTGRYLIRLDFDELTTSTTSSCFVRMMQPHGGSVEGFHFPLRKGSEVVVSFLGGDPDRPVISGFVPNARSRSPVTSDNATQNVIQTGGRNRIELEDRRGAERIDVSSPALNSRLHLGAANGAASHNVVISTDGNARVGVGTDCDIQVGGMQREHVVGALTETYDASCATSIAGGLTETVHSGKTQTVTGGLTQTLTGGVNQTVNGDVQQTTNGSTTQTITGQLNQTITGGATLTTPAAVTINATGGFTVVAEGGSKIFAPAGHTVIAPGGQHSVDSYFSKVGGLLTEKFGTKCTFASSKLDVLSTVVMTVAPVKVDLIGIKVDYAKIIIKNRQLTISDAKLRLKWAALGLYMEGLTIIG